MQPIIPAELNDMYGLPKPNDQPLTDEDENMELKDNYLDTNHLIWFYIHFWCLETSIPMICVLVKPIINWPILILISY